MANVALNIILGLVNNARPGLQAMEGDLRGLRAEAKAAADDMKAQWGEVANLSRQVGVGMVAAGGAAVTGLIAAGKAAADYGSELWDMHTRTGASVESLSALKYAAEQTGSSLEGVQTGLKFVAKNAYAAMQGDGQAADAFKTLGVNVKDAQGNLKSSETLFVEVGTALRGVQGDAERTALAMAIFGRSGQQLLPLFLDTKGSVSDLMAEARKLGLVMTGEAAAAADDFGDSLDRIKAQSSMAFVGLGSAAMPVLQELANGLSNVLSWTQGVVRAHPTLAKGFIVSAAAVSMLLVPVGMLLMLAPGIVAAWNFITAAQARAAAAAAAAATGETAAGGAAAASGVAAAAGAVGWGTLAVSMGLVTLTVLAAAAALFLVIRACNMGAQAWRAYREASEAKKRGRAQEEAYAKEGIVTPEAVAKDLGLQKKWQRGTMNAEEQARFDAELQKRMAAAGEARRAAGTAGGVKTQWAGQPQPSEQTQTDTISGDADKLKAQADALLEAAKAAQTNTEAGAAPATTPAPPTGEKTYTFSPRVTDLLSQIADSTRGILERVTGGVTLAPAAANSQQSAVTQTQAPPVNPVVWQRRTDARGNMVLDALQQRDGLLRGTGQTVTRQAAPQTISVTQHIYGATDPAATAGAVDRRMRQMLGKYRLAPAGSG